MRFVRELSQRRARSVVVISERDTLVAFLAPEASVTPTSEVVAAVSVVVDATDNLTQ